MKSKLPEKLDAHSPHWKMTNTINTLIDHLKDYEKSKEENDDNLYAKLVEVSGNLHTMYKELGNRIQEISNLQLEMSREDDDGIDWGERDAEHRRRKGAPEQPKRWRAKLSEEYFYVTSAGYVQRTLECHHRDDDGHYLIGNYHQTREQATAYKARLLELGQQV